MLMFCYSWDQESLYHNYQSLTVCVAVMKTLWCCLKGFIIKAQSEPLWWKLWPQLFHNNCYFFWFTLRAMPPFWDLPVLQWCTESIHFSTEPKLFSLCVEDLEATFKNVVSCANMHYWGESILLLLSVVLMVGLICGLMWREMQFILSLSLVDFHTWHPWRWTKTEVSEKYCSYSCSVCPKPVLTQQGKSIKERTAKPLDYLISIITSFVYLTFTHQTISSSVFHSRFFRFMNGLFVLCNAQLMYFLHLKWSHQSFIWKWIKTHFLKGTWVHLFGLHQVSFHTCQMKQSPQIKRLLPLSLQPKVNLETLKNVLNWRQTQVLADMRRLKIHACMDLEASDMS